MKNKRFLLGMLAIALAFGITAVGCEGDLVPDAKLNGTWVYEQTYTSGSNTQTYKFDNGSYEWEQSMTTTYFSGSTMRDRGTYHTDDGTIDWGKSSKLEYNGAQYVALANYYSSLGVSVPAMYSAFQSRWYSRKEYEDIMRPYQQQSTETYTSLGTTYEVSGNTLILTYTNKRDSDGTVTTSSTTYTKKGGSSSGSSGGSDTISPPTTNQN